MPCLQLSVYSRSLASTVELARMTIQARQGSLAILGELSSRVHVLLIVDIDVLSLRYI